MSANKLMNISDLANELGTDKITIEFWLKRFGKWLPHIIENDKKFYPVETFNNLIFIAERINAGMLPSEIENDLKKKFSVSYKNDMYNDESDTNPSKNADETMQNISGGNVAEIMKSLIDVVGSSQERIARAHERRAEAEERKAIAIEKRAEAEEKKAIAMNNIANALQNMKHEVWPGNNENYIKGEAVRAITIDEPVNEQNTDDLSSLSYEKEQAETDKNKRDDDIDNLALLLDNDESKEKETTNNKTEQLDDLSLLLDTEPDSDGISQLSNIKYDNDLDDLAALIDENEKQDADDLSSLSYEKEQAETDKNKRDDDIDNLALLLDNDESKEKETTNNKTEQLDDLSLLLDEETSETNSEPELKPSVTLEENFDQYKSEVINSIIELKKKGLSVEETTQRLNRAKVKTFAGKSRWGTKTIAKIYKFIESVS